MRFLLLTALTACVAMAGTFTYTDFASPAGLTLNGDAAVAGNVLRLVPSVDTQSGTAYYSTPIDFGATTGFSTSFEFQVTTDPNDPTDGFTFLLQNVGVNALGAGGQGLGYVGLDPSVAVVFRGRGPSFIGVITGGIDPADLAVPFNPPGVTSLTEGVFYNQPQYAWIDYTPAGNQLNVYLSSTSAKPVSPIMTTTVDIAGTLGGQAYVGFSAGNGGAYGNQDILNWSFTATPEPGTASIYALGLAALGLLSRRYKR